ncbi:MAG: DUF6088 family protein [Bacteriovoracaceae bacterium]
MSQSIEKKVLSRIYGHGRGWVFTLKDFSDLGSEEAIKVSLHRIVKDEIVERLKVGLYYYPEVSDIFGIVPPSLEKIALALASKYKIRIQPSGAYAANLLGLSDQVPAKVVYLTDGETKKIIIGKRQITFKKTTPKNMGLTSKTSGLVIQALRYLGKDHIDDRKISIIKSKLSDTDKKTLLKDAAFAPNWIIKIIRDQIVES